MWVEVFLRELDDVSLFPLRVAPCFVKTSAWLAAMHAICAGRRAGV